MDLSGFTPVALTAREQACQEHARRPSREDRSHDAVRRLLFRPGDPSILPYVDGVDVRALQRQSQVPLDSARHQAACYRKTRGWPFTNPPVLPQLHYHVMGRRR